MYVFVNNLNVAAKKSLRKTIFLVVLYYRCQFWLAILSLSSELVLSRDHLILEVYSIIRLILRMKYQGRDNNR
jgi:hypothetical protein